MANRVSVCFIDGQPQPVPDGDVIVDAIGTALGGGGGITWSIVTANETMTINTGTVANKGTLLTLTLPATASVGSVIRVVGMNTGLWRIAQNTGGKIHFGDLVTTTGVGGYFESVTAYDAMELVCVVADNEWAVVSSIGNFTYV